MKGLRYIGVRIGAGMLDWLDQLTLDHTATRSHVIRVSLAVARNHEAEVTARLKEFH